MKKMTKEEIIDWMMNKGFSTGHGDSVVDLLDELEWQIAEREREACAKICDGHSGYMTGMVGLKIRARGQE